MHVLTPNPEIPIASLKERFAWGAALRALKSGLRP